MMRYIETKIFYFIIFAKDVGMADLSGWTNNPTLANQYGYQWRHLEPVIYEFQTSVRNNIRSDEVKNFVLREGELAIYDFDIENELTTIDVTPFNISGTNRITFIITQRQETECFDSYTELDHELCEIMLCSIRTLEMLSRYVKNEEFYMIINLVKIFIKRLALSLRLDINELDDVTKKILHLPLNEPLDIYDVYNPYYVLMRCLINDKYQEKKENE